MNKSNNHIKHLVDNNEVVNGQKHWRGCYGLSLYDQLKHDANQLDDKQRHTRFDYYEYDMPKFGTPS